MRLDAAGDTRTRVRALLATEEAGGSSFGSARPARVDAAFDTLLLPLLGGIFLLLATLIYALLDTPGRGLTGGDRIWVTVAALLGMGHWAAGATQRNQLPSPAGAPQPHKETFRGHGRVRTSDGRAQAPH